MAIAIARDGTIQIADPDLELHCDDDMLCGPMNID